MDKVTDVQSPNIVGRFAPSPTGRMHMGNVYSALLSWLSAKRKGGRWLLRIEDLDPQRSRREYAMQLMDDLQWLGLTWDGEPLWQSERTEIYAEHFRYLEQQHLVYPCFCTRADILNAAGAPHESDGRVIYSGKCRRIYEGQGKEERAIYEEQGTNKGDIYEGQGTDEGDIYGGQGTDEGDIYGGRKYYVRRMVESGRRAAWRVMVQDETIRFVDGRYGEQSVDMMRQCGDFVVRRSDGVYAYQLAVVVDDALSGVTEVVRGEDLLLSTAQQIYLYRLFREWKMTCGGERASDGVELYNPPRYYHLPLLRNEAGQRLSKRDKAMDMGELRKTHTPEQLLGEIAYIAKLRPSKDAVTLTELLKET